LEILPFGLSTVFGVKKPPDLIIWRLVCEAVGAEDLAAGQASFIEYSIKLVAARAD